MSDRRLLAGLIGIALASTPAIADPAVIAAGVTVPPVAAPSMVSAYIQFAGEYYLGYKRINDGLDESREYIPGFGGSGHLAFQASPAFSMQFDVWADRWEGHIDDFVGGVLTGERSYNTGRMGLAAHAIFNADGGFQAGVMGSVGYRQGFDQWANLGVEFAYNAERFRLNGQVGYTPPIVEWAREGNVRGVYGSTGLSFYITPDFAISANAGIDLYLDCCGFREVTTTFGARVEYQFEGSPVAVFAAYQNRNWTNTSDTEGNVHRRNFFAVGISVQAGTTTLQDRDRAAGFSDYNGIYAPVLR